MKIMTVQSEGKRDKLLSCLLFCSRLFSISMVEYDDVRSNTNTGCADAQQMQEADSYAAACAEMIAEGTSVRPARARSENPPLAHAARAIGSRSPLATRACVHAKRRACWAAMRVARTRRRP